MKTFDKINKGDTVYLWGPQHRFVDKTIVVEKNLETNAYGYSYWDLRFKNGCAGSASIGSTVSSMGIYSCKAYSDKRAVIKAINLYVKSIKNTIDIID